ncbi:hypothetical protein RhiTH_002325 [Rhizoctonia solani]
MSRIPSRQVPTSPGALSPDTQHPTYFAHQPTPTAQPLAAYPPPQAVAQHDLSRAPSSMSTGTSVTSGSSGISTQTAATNITRPSSFSSENPHSPEPELHQVGTGDTRPGPVPLQGEVSPPTRFRQSDPGKASGIIQAGVEQGSASTVVARRQTFPGQSTTVSVRARPFTLSQPPRGNRSATRGSQGRTLWGREGLPARLYDTRYAPGGSPLAIPSNVLTGAHQAPRLLSDTSQFSRPVVPAMRPTHHPIPDPRLVPGVAPAHPIPLQNVARPLEPSGGLMPMASSLSSQIAIPLNPLSSSLTRDALLAHALKLYENPGSGGHPPIGVTARPINSKSSEQERMDPMEIYSIELLPLLTSLRALHPTHLPTALLLACVQYALKDYDGSLRTSHEILTLDPNFVEAMSNIAITLRAIGNLQDAESWWRRAVQLRPSYWDAIDNLIGLLCNPPRATNSNMPPSISQPRTRQALDICEFVLKQTVPGPIILSSWSTGLVQEGEFHRLQNVLYTSGNLKFVLAVTEEQHPDPDKESSGLRDQFAAVELLLNRRFHVAPEAASIYLTTQDLLLGLAVSALYVTGNLPSIPELEASVKNNPRLDLLYHIHNTQYAVLGALASNNVLPLVFIKPENIFSMMTYLFPSTKGLFPGVVDEAGSNLDLEAIPAVLPAGATNASRMTATVLLTVAKYLQEAARRGDTLPYTLPSNGHDAPTIRASLSSALLLYYCALALHPSASVCNNLGILLSTLLGDHITCLVHPPGTTQPTYEVLTGPSLARAYYYQGLALDSNHPHLLTNIGSLLKDEGKLDEAILMYSRALAIKPDFHVALANIANATKDAGRIIESIEYYKRAVLANPYFPESIVGLAGVLGSICDWQGRGGLSSDVYLDVSGNIVVLEEGQLDSRPPGILDKILEICDSQIISAYYASSGIIASDRTLEQWMEIVEACLGPFSTQRRQRWETCLGRFYKPFDRAEKRVYEAGAVVRLIEMLSRVLQRRWYMDSYGSGAYLKGKTRELDRSKYRRPRLPAAMVAPLSLSILPFHTHTFFVTDHKQSFREDDQENALALRGRTPTNELIWKFEEIRRHKLRKTLFPDIHDDWIIYANFNQLYKVDPVVFNSWLRILNRAPKSILWLLRFPSLAEGNLLRCAELWAGPDVAKRIRFTDVAPKEVHVRRCRVADLFLDTIECGAHTVATDVLWAGTPIITWPRYEYKMCSRIAASVAHATGYGHRMIVSSLKDYEDRAVDLAKSVNFVAASDDQGGWYRQCRGALSDLRRSLYLSRDTMPLFDTARWTRNVERAYAEVWRRWETGTEFEESDEWLASSGEEKETSCVYVREE